MALGKTKVVLFRSLFDLLVNILLSILFIRLFGYLGAAVATITTQYLWTVPFNLYHIGKGFEVPVLNTLPFKKMGEVMLVSLTGIFPGIIYLLFPDVNIVVQLGVAATLYFPGVFYILYRRNLLPLPERINNLIPIFLRK